MNGSRGVECELSFALQNTTARRRKEGSGHAAGHGPIARLALAVVLLGLAPGCGSQASGTDGGTGSTGGGTGSTGGGAANAGGGAGSSECEPLAPSTCKQDQGCYFSEDERVFACSKAGSGTTGTACAQDSDCVPKDGCNRWDGAEDKGVCKTFCSVETGSGCASPDICVDLGDPTAGLCGSCPEYLACGSACCRLSQVCSAGACSAPVTCDPMTQNCTTTDQACYFHWGSYQFACQASTGTVADGKECALDSDCTKSSGCYYTTSISTSGICTPYCKPGVSPTTCKSGQTCADLLGDGTLGYCK